MGTNKVGHDFGAPAIAKAILTDLELGFDTVEGLMAGHTLQGLLEEGGTSIDRAYILLFTSSSGDGLGGTIFLVESSKGTVEEKVVDSRGEGSGSGELDQTG
jgi:hypothetical protein